MNKKMAVCLGLATAFATAPAFADYTFGNPKGGAAYSSPTTVHGPFSLNGARVYYSQQNWSALRDYARAWASAAPMDGKPWYVLGEAAVNLGNYDEAVEGFRRSTLYSPNEPQTWNNLAAAYVRCRQSTLALKTIADGEAASGSNCAAIDWYHFGNARKELGDYQHAIADYNRALAKSPNFPEALNNLGVCQRLLGNDGAASIAYNRSAAQGNQIAANNAADLRANARAARQRSQGGSNSGNVWDWSMKSLQAKRAEENSRRDINGNTTPRQY